MRRTARWAVASILASGSTAQTPELAAPFRVTADGSPIEVEVGHADPWLGDWNGDGLLDLLVGQIGSGRLRIYANLGERGRPRFGAFEWFRAGGSVGTVPAG